MEKKKNAEEITETSAVSYSMNPLRSITIETEDEENKSASSIMSEDEDYKLASSIMFEIPHMPSSQCFIYKVPVEIRIKSEKDTFEPRFASIGPYHHGNENLQAAEEIKKLFLKNLISRTETNLIDLVKAIRMLELHARKCYNEEIKIVSNEFVKMMVLDGCFILEVFSKYFTRNIKIKDVAGFAQKYLSPAMPSETLASPNNKLVMKDSTEEKFWESFSPVLNPTWMHHTLRHDLVLLENQIPLIVLEKLFDQITGKKGRPSLKQLVMEFFTAILPEKPPLQPDSNFEGKHLLDGLRNHLLLYSQEMEFTYHPVWNCTPSATELWDAGVRYKQKEMTDSFLKITFTRDGVLEIPPFFFGESWTVLFPNLIALEQCRQEYTSQITSYCIFIDNLINSAHDVKLLRDSRIIGGLSSEDEKVASVMNDLFKGATANKFYYEDICVRLNAYSRSNWHKWRVNLIRTYFNSPWKVISLIAAVVLLILTFTQTLYAALSYSN